MFRGRHFLSFDFRSVRHLRVTERVSTLSTHELGAATETLPLASVDDSRRSIGTSDSSSPPYPCPAATGNDSCNNWRTANPSNPGPSSANSQPNGARFSRLRTPAHGVVSSPVAPHTATFMRFDFSGDESGNEAVATKKGSCEMQGDRVEMQIGDPSAV